MNKENSPKEKQIHLDLPATSENNSIPVVVANDYHTLLKDLILMALPSPSHHIH